MAIGKYPIPPPTQEDLAAIFGPDAMKQHMEAAKTGKALSGKLIQRLTVQYYQSILYYWYQS